ncbi:MAG: signal recognition particle protein Srp19 [Promethearchaeota archaeon]
MRRRRKIRFWPAYFDRNRSRAAGRRLPKNLSVEKVTALQVAKAAKEVGYDVEYEPELRYPRSWWDPPGAVLVDTRGNKKTKVLRQIADQLRRG